MYYGPTSTLVTAPLHVAPLVTIDLSLSSSDFATCRFCSCRSPTPKTKDLAWSDPGQDDLIPRVSPLDSVRGHTHP